MRLASGMAPMAKSKKQIADEAYHRIEAQRLAMPGQLAIDGSIVGEPPLDPMETFRPAAFTKIPPMCPQCKTYMRDSFGGAWTPVRCMPSHLAGLQCGHCSTVIVVTDEVCD